MIGLGVLALDPAWTAHVARGQYLVDARVWVRSPVMFATGAVVLMPGLWLLFAALVKPPVVVANDRTITARTLFGRLRRLDWDAIVAAKRKKNQIILSPVGRGQRWARRSGTGSPYSSTSACSMPHPARSRRSCIAAGLMW